MPTERISYLLKQYLDNALTPEELDELMKLIPEDKFSVDIRSYLEELIDRSPAVSDYQEAAWDPLFEKIMASAAARSGAGDELAMDQRERKRGAASADVSDMPERRRGTVLPMKKWRVAMAAAILLLFVCGGWWFLHQAGRGKVSTSPGEAVARDAAPGRSRAILTLANGATVDLDSAKEGFIGRQGSSQLIKFQGGQLAYEDKDPQDNTPQYNMLTTPRGGQYRLLLPDGSKVWLNAASSIRYPTSFAGGERVVQVTGEAYFEVARNPSMPFRVKVAGKSAVGENAVGKAGADDYMDVEVLGTHFNIMAYNDEPGIKTTLLEGLVRVRKGNATALVKPGEQAKLNINSDGRLQVTEADTEEAVAWKDGLFKFNEATIDQVMRQLSRWYDVEVIYVNQPPKDLFRGEMYRNVNASRILKVLEASGVHFTVEGKRILVRS